MLFSLDAAYCGVKESRLGTPQGKSSPQSRAPVVAVSQLPLVSLARRSGEFHPEVEEELLSALRTTNNPEVSCASTGMRTIQVAGAAVATRKLR